MKHSTLAAATALVLATGICGCIEPPPKIASVPLTGFSLRIHVFGASAVEAQRTFAAVRKNNPSFSLVESGGDGELLVGLENDSPRCIAPTAMCSYRVSYRIKDNDGAVVSARTETVEATADRCLDLCTKALNRVAVKLVEAAVSGLHGGAPEPDAPASADAGPVARVTPDGGAPLVASSKKAKAAPAPAICSAARGPRLESQDAEARAAQVEVLKRMGTLDQDEYDCLRKAYLSRL